MNDTPKKLTQVDKVWRVLMQAGSVWLSADEITNRCGVRQPARRIHDLKQRGYGIESKYLDRSKGIYAYRMVVRPILPVPAPEHDDFAEPLFGGAPKRATSHYDYEDAA